MRHWLTSMTVLLLVVSAAVGCRSVTGKSLGQNVDDSTISATVKARLTADRARNLTAVDVDTNQGVVYLTGNVATAAQKAEAERVASTVDGVKRVVNNLMVEPRAFGATGERAAAGRPATSSPAASPAGDFVGRHTMTGEVTQLDRQHGHVHLRTGEGELQLHFPPAALQNVREGDRLTVELGLKPVR
jgi:hypothetical protein